LEEIEKKHNLTKPAANLSTIDNSSQVIEDMGRSTMSIKINRSELSKIYGNINIFFLLTE